MTGASQKALVASICGAIVAVVLLLAGLQLGVQAAVQHGPVDGVSFGVPLAPGRALDVHLWSRDLAFSPTFSTGGLTRQRPGPPRATLWYRNTTTGRTTRLGVVRLPTWPLRLWLPCDRDRDRCGG